MASVKLMRRRGFNVGEIQKMRRLFFVLFFSLVAASFQSGALSAASKSPGDWGEIAVENRCEGIWSWLSGAFSKSLPDWSVSQPKCEIAGGADSGTSWSLEASLAKGSDKYTIRYQIIEQAQQKPGVEWCLVRNGQFGCATPWDAGFGKGSLFKSEDSARKALSDLTGRSQGFLRIVTDLDAWVGQATHEPRLYGVSYREWISGWVSGKRSLPAPEKPFSAEFKSDKKMPHRGEVRVIELTHQLQECLKCSDKLCGSTPLNFVFSGLSLTISRGLSPDEQKKAGQATASATWIMLEQTPFVKARPAWPMMCGEHRFNIQKL
jgi:hypothetical protein